MVNIFTLAAAVVLIIFVVVFSFSSSFSSVTSAISSMASAICILFIEDPIVRLFEKFGWKENAYSPSLIYVFLFILVWGILFSACSYLSSNKTIESKMKKFALGLPSSLIASVAVLSVMCISLPAFLNSQDSQIRLKDSLVCLSCSSKTLDKVRPRTLQRTTGQLITSNTDSDVIILPDNFSFISESPLLEARLLILVNQVRSENGVNQLTRSNSLDQLALSYANKIIEAKRFAHIDLLNQSPSDRAKLMNIKFDYFGENLAAAPTVEKSNEIMMLSRTHKENLISPIFRQVGIAVINVAANEVVVVEEFSN